VIRVGGHIETRINRLPKARKEELIGQDALIGRIVTQAGKKILRRVRRPGSGA
jgi:hypothetical protein